MLLGGRTAEELIFTDPTTGAQNDIERATKIARSMVTEYGMSDALGPMQFGQHHGEVFLGRDFASQPDYSDEVAAKIDGEVRRLIEWAHGTALDILTTHRTVLDELAQGLMEKETLETDEVMAIFAPVPKWTHAGTNGDGRHRPRPAAPPASSPATLATPRKPETP
jgi:cell division protease FtsH